MTTTIKTTTSARPARRRRSAPSRAIESLHTYHVLGRAEGPVRAHRNVTLRNLHRIRRTHTTVSTHSATLHLTSSSSTPAYLCPASYPTIESIRVADVAYLGRARLLDARAGGVGGLGGNHGVGLGNHRRRVTSIGVRVCRRWTMGDAGVDDDWGEGGDATRFCVGDGWMDGWTRIRIRLIRD